MGSVTIRNVDESVKQGARLEGVKNGRSMEAEIRALLERTYAPHRDERAARIRAMSPADFVHHMIRVADGADVEQFIPPRTGEDFEFPDL